METRHGYASIEALPQKDKDLYTNKLASATDFPDIATALADSDVSSAQSGDYFTVAGETYEVKNSSPTSASDVFQSSGGGGYPLVNTFADLPPFADNVDKVNVVKTTTGIIGLRKLAGLYYSDGASWKRLSANQLKAYDSDKLNGLPASSYSQLVILIMRLKTEVRQKDWWGLLIAKATKTTESDDGTTKIVKFVTASDTYYRKKTAVIDIFYSDLACTNEIARRG
jgi:hypothetical protein